MVETQIVFSDEEIIRLTLEASPDLVSIDAPLFLPRGRESVLDSSPCRAKYGIVRTAERILWARGIRVYPALIRHMQKLTQRGMDLAKRFEQDGIRVIESYPGAAQDILGIPRKGADESLLHRGLNQFGFVIRGNKTHDELDAVTSALVGYFHLAEQFEGIGADDEGRMIIPQWNTAMRWDKDSRPVNICIAGLPGSGKTTLARALAERLGLNCFILGDELRHRAVTDRPLDESLGRGEMAPESLVEKLIRQAAHSTRGKPLIVDGFPRHVGQLALADEVLSPWVILSLESNPELAASRLCSRLTCARCGRVNPKGAGPAVCPACGATEWRIRHEDTGDALSKRVSGGAERLRGLLAAAGQAKVLTIDATVSAEQVVSTAATLLGGMLSVR